MFVIDEVDFAFHIFAIAFVVISVAIFFTAQYILCSRAKKTRTKLIPACFVLLLVVSAILVAIGNTGGSPVDLRGVAALMILGVALICGISAGAAWLTYRVRNKK